MRPNHSRGRASLQGTSKRMLRFVLAFALLLACLAAPYPHPATAEAQYGPPATQTGSVELTASKSSIINSRMPVSRVSVAQPEIADFVMLSPRQIYVTGKKPGNTNLTTWSGNDVTGVYDLNVSPDVTLLKKTMHDVLPDEPDVQVISTPSSVTLAGTIKSTENQAKAAALAEAFSPGKVVNLLQVGGVHQIMLEVRVAEMSKSVMDRMGFNFQYMFNGKDVFQTFLNGLTSLDPTGATLLTPNVNAAFRITKGQTSWSGFIDALKQNGLIKVLAEPTLTCLSGQTASFLAGGEIPVPVPQGLGTVAIEYKEFGVRLKFTPTVLSNDKISLQVSPEVSELDYTNAITINGFQIPALTSRKASTMVELGDGQSFAIAGMLNNLTRETTNRFPVLGDVPVLGNLFRSDQYQKNETELVIIATPRLAKPQDASSVKLPTSVYKDPSDLEFYLNLPRQMGKEGAEATGSYGQGGMGGSMGAPAAGSGGLDSGFGHVLPGDSPTGTAGVGTEAR